MRDRNGSGGRCPFVVSAGARLMEPLKPLTLATDNETRLVAFSATVIEGVVVDIAMSAIA